MYEIHRPIARNTRPYDKEARRINAELLSDHREFIKYFMSGITLTASPLLVDDLLYDSNGIFQRIPRNV